MADILPGTAGLDALPNRILRGIGYKIAPFGFVVGDYNRESSVTEMMEELRWQSLETHREMQG